MTTGPVRAADHQVLQRTGDAAWLHVTAADVLVRVEDAAGRTVVDWSGGPVAVPVGGPYAVWQRTDGGEPERVVTDLFAGDVWVLGGQSNMQGGGVLRDLEPPPDALRVFGMERRWQPPAEPLHRPWRSPDPVHHERWPGDAEAIDRAVTASIGTAEPHVGAGLGVAFAAEYTAATGVPVGLVPAAIGGTGLGEWSPELPDGLYAAMVSLARASGDGVAGLLWHQGEAETGSDESAAGYLAATRALFDTFRRDLGQPDLPVYLAQLAFFPLVRDLAGVRRWSAVRLAQLDAAALGAQGVAATVDLATSDPIHLDAASQRRLGRRFARLAAGRAETMSVAEVSVSGRLVDWPFESLDLLTVRIRLAGVRGGLRSHGRPAGFSVRDPDGALVPAVWRVDVDPDRPDTVVVHVAGARDRCAGADTQCTLADADDNGVPAFGPVPLG